MVRGFPFAQYKWLLIPAGFLILIAGLSGCFQLSGQDPSSPAVVCTPESNQVNIYRSATPQPWVNKVFEDAFLPIPPPIPPNITPLFDDQKILNARNAAFLQLINETKRWSDTQTIKLDDLSTTNITVTFISPELLQAVFLNDVLLTRSVTPDFATQIRGMLNNIAEREELLFLLTVTTTNNTINPKHHTIKIPIDNMNLNNAEDLKIKPSHDDHNLDQLMDTSSDPVSGYLAYPLAVLSGAQCKWILDPKYNTNIVIALTPTTVAPVVSSIEVDGVDNNTPYSWTIPYTFLINSVTTSNTPVSASHTTPDLTILAPYPLPPKDLNNDTDWQNFARFIWHQLTRANY